MTVYIDQARIDDIQAQLDILQLLMDLKQAEVTAEGGPVVWSDAQRNEQMKVATLLAFLSEVDLACYPLSVSSVLFVPP